ncbi:hypothetical protein F5880DRAFT_1606189 [Lentinula raphanica]|nr:hypothetical protein F5880DRAFT_1606189 [Lentinula raphanica]
MVFISRLLPSQSRSHSVPTSNVYCLRNLLVVLLWIFGIASLACAGPIPNIGDISVPPPGRVRGAEQCFMHRSHLISSSVFSNPLSSDRWHWINVPFRIPAWACQVSNLTRWRRQIQSHAQFLRPTRAGALD